jgi:hypothetical protein
MIAAPSLDQLDPSCSPSFSRNLHRWLKEFRRDGIPNHVYRVTEDSKLAEKFGAGELMIGFAMSGAPDDADFCGARLSMVLCEGEKAQCWCFPGTMSSLVMVPDFWANYLRVGRCAIDPAHETYFSGAARFDEQADTRTCLWCGAKQHKQRTQRIVYDEIWVLASPELMGA